jgi:hypothetical protein
VLRDQGDRPASLQSGSVQNLEKARQGPKTLNPGTHAAGEAVSAGAAGLAFVRVLAGGAIDAAKPIKEGLSEGETAALLSACGAAEVCPACSAPSLYWLESICAWAVIFARISPICVWRGL